MLKDPSIFCRQLLPLYEQQFRFLYVRHSSTIAIKAAGSILPLAALKSLILSPIRYPKGSLLSRYVSSNKDPLNIRSSPCRNLTSATSSFLLSFKSPSSSINPLIIPLISLLLSASISARNSQVRNRNCISYCAYLISYFLMILRSTRRQHSVQRGGSEKGLVEMVWVVQRLREGWLEKRGQGSVTSVLRSCPHCE